MKKIIRILFVCLFFIALIFIGKNVLKDGKEREYIKDVYKRQVHRINSDGSSGKATIFI